MAANQERTLKVSFAGDATNLTDVIQVVQNNFKSVDTVIKTVSTTLDDTGKKMVANVELVAKSLAHLETLKDIAAKGIVPISGGEAYPQRSMVVKSDEDALARREAADRAKAALLAQKEADETAKKAAAARAVLSTALKEQSKENVRTFYEEIKSKEVIAQNGANSLIAIKQREKDALLAAEREYNAKVMAYADRIAEGTRTEKQAQADMRKSEAAFERKVRSIKAEAATEIEIEKRKQDEIARLVKEQKATLAIATARQATDPQRMALIRAEVEEERAIQTRGFNDAYVRQLEYNRKRLQAEQALQQELAGIKTAQAFGKFTPEEAFTKSTAALATYKKALQDLPSLNKHVQEHQSLFTKVFELIGAYRILSTVWNAAVGALKAIPKIGIEMESTVASLTATTGSLAGAKLMLGALNTEAQRTGINIAVLRESFRNFYASTSTAGESLQTTWRVFTNLNTVITALHLSADQANGIFNAMAQIFNKSKVQSEELVKQLGNLLPGAFAAFAASMGISTQKLADDMKAGLVFAHDTIENFTEYLATKFYRAFDAAASGLNANVGRMQTSFTLLGEAIYKQSSGAMTDFVKAVTSLADVARGGVEGINNFSYAIKGGFVVAAGLAAGAIVNLVRWFGTLTTVMNLNPFVRFATLLGAAGAAIYEWKQSTESAYEGAAKRAEEYNTAIRNIPDYKKTTLVLDVEQTPEYKAIQADIAATQAKLNELRKGTKQPATFGLFGVSSGAIALDKQEITKVEQELTAHYGREIDLKNGIIAKKEIEGVELRTKMLEGAEKLALMRLTSTGRDKERAQKEYVKQFADEKAYFEKIRADELAKKDGANKDILQQAETFLANYNAEYAVAGDKRKDTLHKQMQEEISLEKKTREDIIAATKDSLQHVDSLYKNSAINIAESIALKRTAIVEGLDAELKELEAQKSIAISYGDTGKARQYEVDMINAQKKAKRELLALSDEEISKSFAFADSMKTLQEAYDKARGTPSASTRFAEEEKRLRAMEQTPTVKGQLDQITYIRNIEQSTAALGKLQTEQQMNTDEYNAKLQRINILKQNGLLGELSATQQLAKLDEENIALREKSLALREKEVEAMPVGTEKDKALVQLKRYKEETENLKITAASVGRLFEEKIGASFERTFTGLVQGTIRGKDAFKSFAASVVSDMISIVAQEARSAILQPLLKAGFSALGGIFGGMFGGASISGDPTGAGLGVAQTVAPVSPFQGTYLANGGVMSGPGISAYSSSIVDRPTIFPFAKGTGLMGEAGPEAIMPLQRINGKLGVRAEIAQSQSQTIVHSPVFNIEMAKNDDPEGVGMKLAEGYIRGIARQEIVNSARIGGKTGQKLAT